MEQKIKILPEKVASLIAAGEIIERISSVVKELIENSIDAKATYIEVNFKDKENVSVFDNGEGMSEKDLLLCIRKHATSKISKEEDLNCIKTLGFRGEALHSISLVSKLTIRSRTQDSELGTEIRAEEGKIKEVKKVYMDYGTQVIVKDLFFNTPARRKFLSTDNVEFSYVLDVFSRYALAFPNISFKLMRSGEVILNLKPKRTLHETIKEIFGEKKNDKIEIVFSAGEIEIEGIIWREKTGIGKWIFVNRRYVRDKAFFSAISKFGFLKNSDYIMFINTPPQMYDVNVNPTKTEIRWRAPSKMREIFITAIEDGIRHSFETREKYTITKTEITKTEGSRAIHEQPKTIEEPQKEIPKILETKKAIKVLSIINGIFSIVEVDGQIYFVDLHAYHEGKYFRELKEKFSKIDKNEILRFAIPFEVQIPKSIILKLIERKSDFEKIGMNIVFDLDESKAKIFSIPYYLSGFDLSEFLNEFSEGFEVRKIEKFLADISCRTVMRKGDRIELWDVMKILEDFDPEQRCPHGRPAVIKLDIKELEEKFGRC